MRRKKHVQKDFYRRQKSKNLEYKRISLRAIQNNLALPIKSRLAAQLLLSKMTLDSAKVRIRNRCILTGRSRGIYKYLKISRIMLREYAAKGMLVGIKKNS